LKIKVSEVAKELGLKEREAVKLAKELGIEASVKGEIDAMDAARIYEYYRQKSLKKEPRKRRGGRSRGEERKREREEPQKGEEKKREEKESLRKRRRRSSGRRSEKGEKREGRPAEEKKIEVKRRETKGEKREKERERSGEAKGETPTATSSTPLQSGEEVKKESKPRRRGGMEALKSLYKERPVIVKKRKSPHSQPQPASPTPTQIPTPSISTQPAEQSAQPQQRVEEPPTPVKKKEKKKTPPKKRGVEEKELPVDIELGEMNIIEEEQVELLDLSFNEIKLAEEEEKTHPKEQKPSTQQQKKRSTKGKSGISKSTKKKRKKKSKGKKEETPTLVKIPKEVRVYEFAELIGRPLEEVLDALRELGEERDKNDFIGEEYIETLADEMGVEVEVYDPLAEYDYVKKYDEIPDPEEKLVERPPIVTVMGHVDHGKTSLLDKIRNTRVAAREAGGITQHIGAYMVEKDGKRITFIDTPGHEAFTEMRARGAQVTDIAIIVVAANDGVMPQTREALAHAQAAGVPFIIAINKIDLPEANPDLVKSQLAEMGITPVEWGGDVEFVEVSARTGEGIDDLLETILMLAEMMELKANPDRPAKAVVIESRLEKGRGPVATVIVKNGTLHKGDSFVCGITYGRVRTIIDDLGKQKKEIKPGEPGEVSGFHEVPIAGDILIAVDSDREAKETAEKWKEYLEEKEKSKSTKATLEDLQKLILEGELKKLPVIVKSDTQGTLEAIKGALAKLRNDEVKVDLIHGDVGAITENDVILAKASEPPAVVLGFNVRPTTGAKNKAKQEGVEIRTYSVIYDLVEDVKELLSGLMAPKIREEVTGTAEVRATFNVPKVGTVAGCYVQDGTIHRNDFARVIRNGVVIYDSKLSSLKRFKDDVKEVGKGFECGLTIEGFNDVKVGDIIETYKKIEEKAKFEE
jgi:translation initiation factor IF-2